MNALLHLFSFLFFLDVPLSRMLNAHTDRSRLIVGIFLCLNLAVMIVSSVLVLHLGISPRHLHRGLTQNDSVAVFQSMEAF